MIRYITKDSDGVRRWYITTMDLYGNVTIQELANMSCKATGIQADVNDAALRLYTGGYEYNPQDGIRYFIGILVDCLMLQFAETVGPIPISTIYNYVNKVVAHIEDNYTDFRLNDCIEVIRNLYIIIDSIKKYQNVDMLDMVICTIAAYLQNCCIASKYQTDVAKTLFMSVSQMCITTQILMDIGSEYTYAFNAALALSKDIIRENAMVI